MGGGESGWFPWGDGNYGQVDPEKMQNYLSTEGMLLPDESVHLSYCNKQDTLRFTSCRMFWIDKSPGCKTDVSYMTLPYSSIQAFAVSTAGMMDGDVELEIWTTAQQYSQFTPQEMDGEGNIISIYMPPEPIDCYYKFYFAKERVDLFALHRYLSER